MRIVAECYSVLTARVVEHSGFCATYIGGEAMGQMHAAVPDHGLVGPQDMLPFVERIAGAISIPLIVDADQGGETTLNVRRTVRDFEHAGAAAIHIEDTINPKHLYDGDRQMPLDEMRARIAAAVDARRSDAFLIIARSDEFVKGNGKVEVAIERGIAFAKMGADVFMLPAMPGKAMKEIVDAVPIPVLDINRRVEQAEQSGLKINLFASSAVPTAIRAHLQLLEEIRGKGALDVRARAFDPGFIATLVDDMTFVKLAKSRSGASET
ncbi:hypothetical protein ATM17_30515 (plasmid) [Sphingopyxis macrogoltabida]|uniref:Isocitrate lyase/PEP mutase family protein n=2 Tax=Sphingopyxis macrogoltabida TaxID=33050 RepID=A0AAC9FHK2_SPHMC|nr:hypothetical protein ATM17_30515 [Sphingopyxis macrogoltabida]